MTFLYIQVHSNYREKLPYFSSRLLHYLMHPDKIKVNCTYFKRLRYVFQSEQVNSLTASNAELSTNVATLNTQKTRLDGQLKESSMSMRKLADEKKQIMTQLEEVSNKSSTMEKQLQEANKKLEISDKSIITLQDEMHQKLKESTNTVAGNFD